LFAVTRNYRPKIGKKKIVEEKVKACVCVCVCIFRLAEHVLKARVLGNPKDYKTPGEVGPWVSV
jgi:hypothetical protein